MEKSWNLTNKFLFLMNRRRYAAAFQNPTNMYVDIESWNFVIRSWKSHGILSRRFRGNPDKKNTIIMVPIKRNDIFHPILSGYTCLWAKYKQRYDISKICKIFFFFHHSFF